MTYRLTRDQYYTGKAKAFTEKDRNDVLAQRIWLILVSHVMGIKYNPAYAEHFDIRINYGEVLKRMKKEDAENPLRSDIGNPLNMIGEYCKGNSLPVLSSIVVMRVTGVPGEYIVLREGKTFEQEQNDVAATDWFEIRIPTTGTFRTVRSNAGRYAPGYVRV